MKQYVWKIHKDLLAESAEADGDKSAVGVYSISGFLNYPTPSAPHVELMRRLDAGEGHTFLMEDDDGLPYYEGRILVEGANDLGELPNGGFDPMDEFGMPDSGCTAISYKQPSGEWEYL